MIDLKGVVNFCVEELGITDKVVVEVYLEDLTEDHAHGWCHNDFENDDIYELEIEKTLDDDEMLVALCHEMVHVRQYSEGYDANETEAYELENELAEKYRSLLVV